MLGNPLERPDFCGNGFEFTRGQTGSRSVAPILWVLAVVLAWNTGCQTPGRQIEVVDYPTGTAPQAYHQEFDTCYYRKSPDGSLDVLAERLANSPGDPPGGATQTIRIRIFYNPIPSRSHADPTMTNALVSYMVMGTGSTCTFDGGGFVTWEEMDDENQLTIYVERAVLTPQRNLGDQAPIFERPRLSGTLLATRDDRRVITQINELSRTFGPLPDKPPPMTDPKLR